MNLKTFFSRFCSSGFGKSRFAGLAIVLFGLLVVVAMLLSGWWSNALFVAAVVIEVAGAVVYFRNIANS